MERNDIVELLAIMNSNAKINLRWPENNSYWLGKFDEAILDVEVQQDGNPKEVLMLYFDEIHSN